MTPKQILEDVRDFLRELTWPSSANLVFGERVYVVAEIPIQQLPQYGSPCAFVVDQGNTSHPEHHRLCTQNFNVQLFIENLASNYGEGGILSRNKVANTSSGTGSKEIEAYILKKMSEIMSLTTKIVLIGTSRSKPQIAASNYPLIFVSVNFKAFCWIE